MALNFFFFRIKEEKALSLFPNVFLFFCGLLKQIHLLVKCQEEYCHQQCTLAVQRAQRISLKIISPGKYRKKKRCFKGHCSNKQSKSVGTFLIWKSEYKPNLLYSVYQWNPEILGFLHLRIYPMNKNGRIHQKTVDLRQG